MRVDREARSRGRIRRFDAAAIDLYDRVGVGTRVVVTWQKLT